MNKKFLLLFLLVTGLSFTTQAQFKDWGTKLGLRYNQLFPENEFKNIGFSGNDKISLADYQFSYLALAEGFIAFEVTKTVELQLNIGYGSYAGKDYLNSLYRTEIIPVDLRIRISPFDMRGWNPYFYFGGGAMHYNVLDEPDQISPIHVQKDGWTGEFPMGIGSEFAITPTLLLDIAIGGATSTTSSLNYYKSKNSGNYDSYFVISTGLTFTGESGSSDRDNDGLTKDEEDELGTNSKNPDSDGDGISDGDEVNKYKTNPLLKDSDLDGLNDNQEIKTFHTNPNWADTDNDGINDGDEVRKYKTDPLKSDTDGDGLSDGDEVLKYRTDPNNVDTDGDSLSDGDEVSRYKTNPLNKDSDSDGLTDYEEIKIHNTNPNKSDTDLGGVNDGAEVKRGTNPLDPDDDYVKIGAPVILKGINFGSNEAKITSQSEKSLREVLRTLQTYPDIYIEISGYTDNTGSRKLNQKLSQKRADAVKDWLVSHGIDSKRITAKGYGPDKPIASNKTEEGKAKNRRIEFMRTK